MASGPITSWEIDGETVETVSDFILEGSKNHCRWWLQPWNKKMLTTWEKSYDQPCEVTCQSCRAFCDPMDCSPPGSSVHGIFQARVLEWGAKCVRWVQLCGSLSILWHSAFFMVQLSHSYMTTGKTIALTRWTFVGKEVSLFFNVLSRLVIREGNGNPLQYSCLENPMDGGAW